jgi:hypothetical protein
MSRRGYKQSIEHKIKRGLALKENARTNQFYGNKGKIFSMPHKDKISKSKLGIPHSIETKEKIRVGHINNAKINPNYGMKNKNHSLDTKKKIRISIFNYAKKVCNIICPRVGHNEKQILDKIETKLKYIILRQYEVEGYFVDGYIPELNLVIEIDEVPKISLRDTDRQKII